MSSEEKTYEELELEKWQSLPELEVPGLELRSDFARETMLPGPTLFPTTTKETES